MGECCYTCDHCHREQNDITRGYLYFCKKLRKSVLANWSCGFFKHDHLTSQEKELQELIDAQTHIIYEQLGIHQKEEEK